MLCVAIYVPAQCIHVGNGLFVSPHPVLCAPYPTCGALMSANELNIVGVSYI
jgi:hypothetical protein